MIHLFVSKVFAQGYLYDYGNSIRNNGMGGAHVFLTDDASAFLSNPAYTCFSKGFNWSILNIGAGYNGQENYQKFSSLSVTGLSSLDSIYGTQAWAGLYAHTTFTLPCFGLSMNNNADIGILLRNPVYPNLVANVTNDFMIQLGAGLMLSQNVAFAVAPKKVNRRGSPVTIGVSDLISSTNSSLQNIVNREGNAYGVDLGLVARYESAKFQPTLSLMWKDVGSTTFTPVTTSAPDLIRDNLIFNASAKLETAFAGIGAAFQYRHITETGYQIGKKIHMGVEANIAMLELRAGYFQGYPSYGLGVDLWFLKLEAAQYGFERGYYAGQTQETRTEASLMMEFSFDANFKLMDVNGRKRRLKQRR